MYAIKVELKLNNQEKTLMAKHAGFSRVVYNYGLSLYSQLDHKEYKVGSSKKITTIKKVLTNYTKKKPEFAWMNELSSTVYQSAFQALQKAFSRFFKGLAEYPTFKRKKSSNSFTVYDSNGVVLLNSGKQIKIPTLGTFRLKEKLSARYVTQTFTISRKGDRWFVCAIRLAQMGSNTQGRLASRLVTFGLSSHLNPKRDDNLISIWVRTPNRAKHGEDS